MPTEKYLLKSAFARPKKRDDLKVIKERGRRFVYELFIHCSATKPQMDIGVSEIRKWHMARGWDDIGYHFVIRRDGTLEFGREQKYAGAHVYGRNASSLGICLIGGIDENGKSAHNYTDAQMKTLRDAVDDIKKLYPELVRILGHRDAPADKDCPCFDVATWLETGGLTQPEKGFF